MHEDLRDLSLTFPLIPIGSKETPQDLRRLLYKGGASVRVNQADKAIKIGLLGGIQKDRVELVRLIHENINGDLAGGGSPKTAVKKIDCITHFFGWSDKFNAGMNILEIEKRYLEWTEHLLHRVRVVKDLKQISAYGMARIVGQVLDGVLGRARPISCATRIRRPDSKKQSIGIVNKKQNLHVTFEFGRLLQDICDETSLAVIWGPPVVHIHLQSGLKLEFKSSGRDPKPEMRSPCRVRKSREIALAYEIDRSLGHKFRNSIINLRIKAELLMFIGQTGMNLAQAAQLQWCRFSYSSDINSYKVREYKPRRKGEVLFEIFSEYRNHFERYLEWRRQLFPDTEKRLFPIIRRQGVRESSKINFPSIKNACEKSGITWASPSSLRGTRVNWLLRRTGDADMTADMAQHHKQTLLNHYETPSLQRAVSEITRFHLLNDPALVGKYQLHAVAPGECDGVPEASSDKPNMAPAPDCLRPSGCLWCDHHRDIDSLDYLWSLACFRHLKIIELSRVLPKNNGDNETHPAEHAIFRLSEKLSWFRQSNATRCHWVEESLARVEEGFYHENWSHLIEAMEGAAK